MTTDNIKTKPAGDLPVRCNKCDWEGKFKNLKTIVGALKGYPVVCCPACYFVSYLEFSEEV